uniref:Alpha-1,3-glucosyltransferase n=1 Tax=Calcidiscus leptoporus TaxID=127549 RepID=A0A7S0P5N8_9EUKA
MLTLSPTPYLSQRTRAYQRATVMLTDVFLAVGAHCCTCALPATLVILDAGLLLVDHVHFQYNGMLIGILLLSLSQIRAERPLCAAALYTLVLNMKHLFLFAAPLYFIYLLRRFVLRFPASTTYALAARRLLVIGSLVMAIFALSFGPFAYHKQLPQLLARLFPFGRGLTHAYWAPNTWALYTFTDKLAAAFGKAAGLGRVLALEGQAVGTGGLIGETPLQLLPQVSPAATAALVLLAQVPVLLSTWRTPRPQAFGAALAVVGLCAFLLGYHVHEKAVLPPLLILACVPPTHAEGARLHARLMTVLSAAAHVAQLPLVFGAAEYLASRAMVALYATALKPVLCHRLHAICGDDELRLRPFELGYVYGFLALELTCSVAHPLLVAPRLPFVPLMLTSVYCAVGIHYGAFLAYQLWAIEVEHTRDKKDL